ncbi:PucR family transcriptional regulator [Leucobacter sp. GX0328]
MSVTVRELAEMSHLQLSIAAGSTGLDRVVAWAHTSDIEEPWRFLVGGELLMTNGLSVPKAAAAQGRFVRQLHENGAVALVIGEEMYAPPISRTMLRTCDELGFPLLWIAYPKPFVAVAREIAEATQVEQSSRLRRTERMYRAMHRAADEETGFPGLIDAISAELECEVRVCIGETGENWAPGQPPMPAVVREAIGQHEGSVRAGATSIDLPDGRRALLLDLPAQPDAVLVALPDAGRMPDLLLLQHAATIGALAVSQLRLGIEYRRRFGAELLNQMLDGKADSAEAARALEDAGIDLAQAVLVAARNEQRPERLAELHVRLWQAESPHLTIRRGETSFVVLPAEPRMLDALGHAVGDAGCAGASNPIGSIGRLVRAREEAGWALRAAEGRNARWVAYADTSLELGPRGPEEARLLIDRVLGPVLGNAGGPAELMATLEAFLEHGRSWRATAETLHLHRHTVMYRIRKIEELTGHDLSETGDLARLWLAVQAYRQLRDER